MEKDVAVASRHIIPSNLILLGVGDRCQRILEDQECRLREVQRRLQKLQVEHEELVERNEELEALLGEEQNTSKEERERHEGEVEGLRRQVRRRKASKS